jgi:outer membrane protein, adhesin transport system
MIKVRRDNWRDMLIATLLSGAAAAPAGADGLGNALQAALRNHPAVAGQDAEVQAQRYAADGARSQRYPTLSAQAQQYAERDRSVLTGQSLSHPTVVRLRQPIWAFGRISNSIAAADAEVDTERAQALRVRRQLLEATAVTYARVRGNRQHIDIARQNVSELEALYTQIQRRVAGQLASSADARLAATRLAQARALLEHAIGEWDIARQDLAGLTQETISAEQPVPTELLALPESPDLIESALDHSAEIRLKQQQLGRAEAEVDRARTSWMPTIYLQADRFYDQPGLRDDSQISVVLEASLDGLGFAARGRMGEAAASRLAATQDLAAVRIELRRELERLRRSRQLQTQLIDLQTQALRDLESLLDSYQRQYETGTKSWLDLLNIQRELYEQRRQLLQAHNDWQTYSLQLLARTGGLDSLAGIRAQTDG